MHEVKTQKNIDFQKVNVSGTLDRCIPIVQANLDVASSGPWSVGLNLLSVITDMKVIHIDILGLLKQCFYGSTH